MNRLYRISALALAAALCLALAACGPKLPGTNSGSSSAVSTPAASGSGSVSGSASVSSGGAGDTMSEGQRYAYAIRDARPAEDNEYSEIACGDAGGEPMPVSYTHLVRVVYAVHQLLLRLAVAARPQKKPQQNDAHGQNPQKYRHSRSSHFPAHTRRVIRPCRQGPPGRRAGPICHFTALRPRRQSAGTHA